MPRTRTLTVLCSLRYRRATVWSETPRTAAIRLNGARPSSCSACRIWRSRGSRVGRPTGSGLPDHVGHLVEQCPQLCGLSETRLLGDPPLDPHDHGVGIPQGVAAGFGGVPLPPMAVARVWSAFQLTPLLQAAHLGSHCL